MPDIPIIGQGRARNGQPVRALPQKYIGELTTADGVTHRHEYDLGVPVGADGTPDLGGLAGLNPEFQFLENVSLAIQNAHRTGNGVALDVAGGGRICLLHVVSWRYLGTKEDVR